MPAPELNLLKLYRAHRDEINALTDERALFALAYLNHIGPTTRAVLQSDLALNGDDFARILGALTRAELVSERGETLSVTPVGQRVLAEIGITGSSPPPPHIPSEPVKRSPTPGRFRWLVALLVALGLLAVGLFIIPDLISSSSAGLFIFPDWFYSSSSTPTQIAALRVTDTPWATDTPIATDTRLPTDAPSATASPPDTATFTPQASPTPTLATGRSDTAATRAPTISPTPSRAIIVRPTNTATPTPTRTPTFTPTRKSTPTPTPTRDTVAPTISGVRAAPNPVSYSTFGYTSCSSATTLVITSFVSDKGTIASVIASYYYNRLNNTPASRQLSTPMVLKNVIVLGVPIPRYEASIDLNKEANTYLNGQDGQIVYWVSATDAAGNRSDSPHQTVLVTHCTAIPF